jgi:hypothetical protein
MLKYNRMEEQITSEENQINLPEPNPVTRAAHKKDFFKRVILPLVLGILVLIALVVTFILVPVGDIGTWSQIATIFLIGLWLLIGLILLILVGVLVYLVSYVLKVMPSYTRMAQNGIETIREQATKGADITVKPVIQIQSFLAAVNAIFGRKK